MQPNQPSTPPDYNFILQNQPQSSGPAFLRNQSPQKQKLIAAAFIGIVLFLVLIIGLALFSGSSENETALKRIIAQQTEIVRVANLGQREARDLTVRNKIATLQVTTSSDLALLTSYATSNGVSINEVELVSARDTSTDEALESANQRGSYDAAIEEILVNESIAYQQLIATAQESSSSEQTNNLLDQISSNTTIFTE